MKATDGMDPDFRSKVNASPETAHGYETLMSSLHLLSSTKPGTSLLVTSTQPEEGKTTVTVNLALTMVRAGKNILLVDTDCRRPKIHQIFKLENTRGFVDILAGTSNVEDVVQVVRLSDNDGEEARPQALSVIPSGMVTPTSFHALGSPKLKEAIECATRSYDVVLLDSPPTLSVSDPLLLAPMVSGIVLVMNTGVVTERDAKQAKERLEQAGGHILGVVMNRFDERRHGPALYPYHDYYSRKVEPDAR